MICVPGGIITLNDTAFTPPLFLKLPFYLLNFEQYTVHTGIPIYRSKIATILGILHRFRVNKDFFTVYTGMKGDERVIFFK